MEEEASKLHIVMLPWVAMGHLLPFFELSKRLALKGLHISFFSTPSNILRLPSVPQTLTPFLNFIPCSLPPINNLPSNIDNTADLPSEAARPLLSQAYAAFEHHLIAFLSDPSRPKPNWIIYDFAATSWAPDLASRFNLNSAFFCLFNAASLFFFSRAFECDSPEKLTTVPDGIPFPTTVAFRPFEARQIHSMIHKKTDQTDPAESKPRRSQLILIRTCREFETKWLDLIGRIYNPVGLLPPSFHREDESETWARIHEWLDEREDFSVVYAAFGSEVKLTEEQIEEIGLGLEQSGLPIGGFLTHGGWNSVVEAMVAGVAMVVLPMMYEQGLNARNLVESGYGVEVVRNDEDGYFSGEEIGRKLRMVMVGEEGEELRKKARKGEEIFGSEKLQDDYVVELLKKLWEKQSMVAGPV